MWKISSSKTVHLRRHFYQFVEFAMKNFYVINWTNIRAQTLLEVADTTFGPYKDYTLCNLIRVHCCKAVEDMRKPFGIKDLEIIWENTFMIDPTSLPRTLPSPPIHPALEIKYEDEINRVTDSVSKKLYFGKDPNLELHPNSRPLKFDKTNTILLEARHSSGNPQPDNLIMVSKIRSLKNIENDTTLLILKDYLDTMATQYRSEFDKCEVKGIEFNFSVQDYMKNNPFKESHSLSSSDTKF
ncbi:hypothetical protein CONCODRAFT_78416 [Conidiobolus coronatus NRRL 28638]|uniref:Uncharacterized protein n=1 Tax=Conidiobolus coronatus (strain ATCC 28846 / CBS 209.66 / NRRL 28638) TaxID=796925 RepID=A0A137P8F2_CONC2|nr:hypothetical protein CONCODRAFT_78416 [Conidiobolus coronatus NRRL 28638]|eukprot:KXN71280.1 hypothetical protein CONCODRAFT_78416 [Conidiobolus coronatus NRRL 28638]